MSEDSANDDIFNLQPKRKYASRRTYKACSYCESLCPRSTKMRSICCCVMISTILLFGFTASCIFRNPTVLMYPMHASCNITWTLSKQCDFVAQKLVQQIELWKTNETCGDGQKCLYKLESIEENTLTATHMSPAKPYIEDLIFRFYNSTTGCHVVGFSTSRTWYALLDSGTNYCNLHNLVDGAGLREDPIYSELTRDEICTQYTDANCDKF